MLIIRDNDQSLDYYQRLLDPIPQNMVQSMCL